MRSFLHVLVLVVLAPALELAESAESEAQGDEVQLSGKWIVTSVEIDAKATPAQIGREVGDVITIEKEGEKSALPGSLKLLNSRAVRTMTLTQWDTSKNPKHLDLKLAQLDLERVAGQLLKTGATIEEVRGSLQKGEMKGIYQLTNMKLIYCLAAPGKPRPTSFDTLEGSGQILVSLEPYRTGETPVWNIGAKTLARIDQLKPVFGPANRGIKLGIAYATPQQKFSIGKRIPIEKFLMNVGEKDVTFEFTLDLMASPPRVVNSRGDEKQISNLLYWPWMPTHSVKLRPGEACSLPSTGLGLGQAGPASLESPDVGNYKLSYELDIASPSKNRNEAWKETLTSGSLAFRVAKNESGSLGVETITAEDPPETDGPAQESQGSGKLSQP